MLFSGKHNIENQGFGELGYQELIGKQQPDNSVSSKVDSGKITNPFLVSPNEFCFEDESTSRLSSSVVESTDRDSSFIDLKLGQFIDPRDAQNSRISKGTAVVCSSESSTPPKRVRMGVNSHTAYCQVYGCNKDLSSSKEYHKKHKVCEVHTKTAKVTVNGIEQRFCQQCSRFHLLAEFDAGKRSCRKRLAGHNERRRKLQVAIHSERSGRLLQSYNGYASGRFHGTPSTTSFISPDILPSDLLHPDKCGTNDWCRHIKVEDETDFNPLSAIPITDGHLHSKPLFPSNNFEKMFPNFHNNISNTATGSIFSEKTNRYPHDLGGSNSGSRSLLQSTSLANEDFTYFNATSSIQGLSGITVSSCALSLLSPQSQNSSSHSSGFPMVHPLVMPSSNTHYGMNKVSEEVIGISSGGSTGGLSNKYCSLPMNFAERGHLGPILISDGSNAINFDITDGIYQGSHFVNAKDHLSCEDVTTIDLLQLSSQLQRVECQKQSLLVKQENDAFRWSSIT